MQGVRVLVWGDYALFSRPEFKTERVSYDVLTPTAARGILDAIHYKPAILWVVDRIRVLRPIRYLNIRRNEVGSKLARRTAEQAMQGGESMVLWADEDRQRQQRASLLLRDVAYVIEAHFEMTSRAGPDDSAAKHADMARRRIAKGQCAYQPCFGTREFPAYFAPAPDPGPDGQETVPPIPDGLAGVRDLGWMLHSLEFAPDGGATPRFFQARLQDGVLEVPRTPFGGAP